MGRGLLQPSHIVILLVVVLVVFGASRLPQVAKSLGESMKIFKNEVKELREDPEPGPVAQAGGEVPSSDDTAPKA